MSRSFGRWQKTECDRCGCEFEVTRTHEKVIEGEVICGDCEVYERGFKDGIEAFKKEIEASVSPVFKPHIAGVAAVIENKLKS